MLKFIIKPQVHGRSVVALRVSIHRDKVFFLKAVEQLFRQTVSKCLVWFLGIIAKLTHILTNKKNQTCKINHQDY